MAICIGEDLSTVERAISSETEALAVALVMGLRWIATMGLRVMIVKGHTQSHANAICSQDPHVF